MKTNEITISKIFNRLLKKKNHCSNLTRDNVWKRRQMVKIIPQINIKGIKNKMKGIISLM